MGSTNPDNNEQEMGVPQGSIVYGTVIKIKINNEMSWQPSVICG